MKDLTADQDESKKLLAKLMGMRLTDARYDGKEIVLEFDNNYQLQLSPNGCEVRTRKGAPDLG